MAKLDDKLAEAFKAYPKVKELFSTTDGNVFLEESKAHAHSFNLEKRDITTHSRVLKTEKTKEANTDSKAGAKKTDEKVSPANSKK